MDEQNEKKEWIKVDSYVSDLSQLIDNGAFMETGIWGEENLFLVFGFFGGGGGWWNMHITCLLFLFGNTICDAYHIGEEISVWQLAL